MLTPAQLKNTELTEAENGYYSVSDVNKLLSTVINDYEQIFEENGNLIRKISVLAAKLDEFR